MRAAGEGAQHGVRLAFIGGLAQGPAVQRDQRVRGDDHAPVSYTHLIKKNSKLERFELPRNEALEFVKDEPYKVELINDLPEDSIISFYKQEGFTDLCAGPHLPSTGRIKRCV